MVLPILNYGCETWGFHNAADVEKLHLRFLKTLLGVKQQTNNAAVYGELGRVPLSVIRKERILKYWQRIVHSPNSLIFKMYRDQRHSVNNTCTWAYQVKTTLCDLGYAYLWESADVSIAQINMVIQRLYDQNTQSWFSQLSNSSKLDTYRTFKTDYNCEKYLS